MIQINLRPASESFCPSLRVAVATAILIMLIGSLAHAETSIANGTVATSTDYPAAVSLTTSIQSAAVGANGWNGSCTGFLVAPNLVITAAHCFAGGARVTSITNAPDTHGARGSYSFKIGKSGSHPGYVVPNSGMTDAQRMSAVRTDIGYITLNESVPETTIHPLPVFAATDSRSMMVYENLRATLVGYGASEWRADGNYAGSHFGTKHFGDKLITDVQIGYILMAGEKNGSLPGDSGGPIIAEFGGVPTAIALNEGMEAETADVPQKDKDGNIKLDRKGNPKMHKETVYGNSIGTMLTRDNLCWVIQDSKVQIPGVDCSTARATQ